ncbi:GGDEF domain-containing protein [Thalassomonas viridans]|uniref:diguanylate cyclase n=1 Tax=Thalassomonas viridans TaxID=137584 RepID=A0AAF0C8E7_9GAMM|nr:GGDEF domain-containing protein [Thalassomonas viridans]WDE06357.1 GGDEF domain-containing protein [Thalassomonas viridans]
MHNYDNYQSASALSKETLAFLVEHTIPPSPVNYSVIYHYLSQRNSELTAEIDFQLTQKNALDGVLLDDLFVKFLSNSDDIENNLLLPFEKTLSQTLDKIDDQAQSEEVILANLAKADHALSDEMLHKPLKNIVNFLIGTISHAQKQHQQLSEELAKTSEEVTSLKSKLEESREEAVHDALTGLLNRRGCDDKLQALDINDRHSSLVIDIDDFKKINDTFGHQVGDKVIQKVAKIIKSSVSESDLAARYGGEEFLVVTPHRSISQARELAEQIRLSVADLKLIQRKSNTFLPTITVSVGIAELANDNNWPSFFQRADQALYKAKNAGKNCCINAS